MDVLQKVIESADEKSEHFVSLLQNRGQNREEDFFIRGLCGVLFLRAGFVAKVRFGAVANLMERRYFSEIWFNVGH